MEYIHNAYIELLNFLSPLNPLFENAGFFFVPVFMLVGLFNIRALRQRLSTGVFFFIAGAMMLAYLIIANTVGRYLLIPLLLCGCLSGAGLEFLERHAVRGLHLRKLPPPHTLLIFLTIFSIACCMAKIAQRGRTNAMAYFTSKIRNDISRKSIILGVDSPHSRRLVFGQMPQNGNIEFYNLKTWEEAFDILTPRQSQDLDFYFSVRMPKKYNISDYICWFRGMYSIFPFDVMGETKKGKNRYLLLKFNRKVSDGRHTRVAPDVLDALPEPLVLKKNANNWLIFDAAEFIRKHDLAGLSFKFQSGSFIRGKIFTRLFGQDRAKRLISLHNELCWPLAACERNVTGADAVKPEARNSHEAAPATPSAVPREKLNIAADPPLLLQPPEIPVLPEDPVIHVSNFLPLWNSGSHRYEPENGLEAIPIPPETATQTIRITDTATGKKNSATFKIAGLYSEVSAMPELRILLVEDNQHIRLNLRSELKKILSPRSTLDYLQLGHGELCSFSIRPLPPLPQKKYHAVVLNIFGDAIVRPWSVPFKTGPFFDEHLTSLTDVIIGQYPDTPLLLLLPPPPSAEPSLYPLCDSPQFGRLSHFRICSAADRWFKRNQPENTVLVPLYSVLDPQRGYAAQRLAEENATVHSGFAFTDAARRRMARAVVGMIIRERGRKNRRL